MTKTTIHQLVNTLYEKTSRLLVTWDAIEHQPNSFFSSQGEIVVTVRTVKDVHNPEGYNHEFAITNNAGGELEKSSDALPEEGSAVHYDDSHQIEKLYTLVADQFSSGSQSALDLIKRLG